MKGTFISFCFLLVFGAVAAQDSLTIEDAIVKALENNYAIKIARNDLAIDENNLSRGNAGFLPTVNADFQRTYGTQKYEQTRSRDDSTYTISGSGVKTLRQTYGATLNWTIFDGMRMFYQYDQLEGQKMQGEYELKLNVETLLYNLLSTFYGAALEKERQALSEINVQLSEERLVIAKDKYELGKASKLEYLQAQVDYNSDRSLMIRQMEVLASSKFDLMELMADKDDSINFALSYDLKIDRELQLEDLLSTMELQNKQLQIKRMEEAIARQEESINKADRLPSVGLFADYSRQNFETPAGFAVAGSSSDITYGISASWMLFDGFNLNRRIQNAKISTESAQHSYQQQVIEIETDIKQIYLNYRNNLNLLVLEGENLTVAGENNEIAQDRYEIGLSNSIELRESQVNLINAQLRYQNAAFAAKQAEIDLKYLAGILME